MSNAIFTNIYSPPGIKDPTILQYLIYLSNEINRNFNLVNSLTGASPTFANITITGTTTLDTLAGHLFATAGVVGVAANSSNLASINQDLSTTSEVSFQPVLSGTGKGHLIIHNHAAEIGWYHYNVGTTVHGGSLVLMGDDSLQLVTGAGLALNQGFTITTAMTTLTTLLTLSHTNYLTAGILHNAVTTGIITSSLIVQADIGDGLYLPTTTDQTNWGTAYTLSHARSHNMFSDSDHFDIETYLQADNPLLKTSSPSFAGLTIGTLVLAAGSITDTSGAISFSNENLSTTGTLGAGAITGTSFIIGANTLTTSEWAFLDGTDQALKTTSSPIFATITGKTGASTYLTIDGTGTGYGAIGAKLDLFAAGEINWSASLSLKSTATGLALSGGYLEAGLQGILWYYAGTLISPVQFIYSKLAGETLNRFEVDCDGQLTFKPGDGLGTNCVINRLYTGGKTYLGLTAANILTQGDINHSGDFDFTDALSDFKIKTLAGILIGTAGVVSAITDSSANWDTAYTHSQDNTQAHSDYLLNSGDDSMAGILTAIGLTVSSTATAATSAIASIIAGNAGYSHLYFGDTDSATRAKLSYNHANDYFYFDVAGATVMYIASNGYVGIGKTPDVMLDLTGQCNANYFQCVTAYRSADASVGVSGTFTTVDLKTVTVKNGIITDIT